MTGLDGRCDADWLRHRLESSGAGERGQQQQQQQLMLVDCRPASEYGAVRISGAVNLTLPSLIQRRLLRGNLATPVALGYCSSREATKIGEEQWRSSVIVLYDDDDDSDASLTSRSPDVTSDDDDASTKVVSVLAKQLTRDGYTVCHLSGGLKEFRAKHPHLCTTRRHGSEDGDPTAGCIQTGFRNLRLSSSSSPEAKPDPEVTSSVPVEVLPHLYLGDARNAADLECLEGNGIRYIVNVTPNVPNAFETNAGFRYLQIPINDHWSQSLTNYFPQAITFIDEGRRLNAGVLVHCLAGISRSVTVTVAYLMYSMSLSLNDAYDYVKQRKPNVSPNLTFMGQLLDFENALKADRQRCRCPSASASSSSSTTPSSFCSSISSSESETETGNCRHEAG